MFSPYSRPVSGGNAPKSCLPTAKPQIIRKNMTGCPVKEVTEENLKNVSGSASQQYFPSGEFGDAVVRVGGVEFNVNKSIFCNCSEYFEALFVRYSPHERKLFEIPDLSADMMPLIVDFAYTGSVYITENNVQELCQAADLLNINAIIEMCCIFLVEKLCPDNCIGMWQFTKIYFLPELKHKSCRYIMDHFEEVFSSEEFQMLSVEELTYILDQDELNVRQETIVSRAIFKWISHAPEERKKHFAILLSKVRLTMNSLHFLVILKAKVEQNNIQCPDVVSHAIEVKRHIDLSRPCLSNFADTIARPRHPNAILLAIGGRTGVISSNAIEAYDIRANQWNNLTDLGLSAHPEHCSVFYDNCVYFVGGFVNGESSNKMCRFDLKTRIWEEAAPMQQCRTKVAITVLNGCIYVMGGYDGTPRIHGRHNLKSAECYNPKTKQWSFIGSMHDKRRSSSCTVLNNKIYICGGFNGQKRLHSCEYYTPETNMWTRFTSMSVQRNAPGIIAYKQQIFAVGGCDGSKCCLSSVEAYDPQTNTWHAVSSMRSPRSYFGIGVMENKIFVVGGCKFDTILNDVEYYDATRDQWYSVSDMGIARKSLSCCVVSELPNKAEYITSRDTLPKLDQMELCRQKMPNNSH